jgi:hypothetical protein
MDALIAVSGRLDPDRSRSRIVPAAAARCRALFERRSSAFAIDEMVAAEIVYRKPHVVRLQFFAHFTGEREIIDNLLVMNVDDQFRAIFDRRVFATI